MFLFLFSLAKYLKVKLKEPNLFRPFVPDGRVKSVVSVVTDSGLNTGFLKCQSYVHASMCGCVLVSTSG